MRRAFTSHLVKLAGAFVLTLLVGLALSGCGKHEKSSAAEPARVTANAVEFSPNAPQLHTLQIVAAKPFQHGDAQLTGQLVWDEDCTNRVFSPVAGRIEKVIAEVGQQVNKGDDLAEMRSPDFAQADADYEKAVSDLAQFEKALTREKTLAQHGAAAAKDVEGAQADYNRAVAEKQRAQLHLQLLGGNGDKFTDLYRITAPIAGVVVDKNVNVGQEVRADIMLANAPQLVLPLFTITDPTKLWLQLDVPENELAEVHANQPLELKTSAYPDSVFDGNITVVSAALDPQTRVAHARATVDNSQGLLKAGMYVSVDVKELAPSANEVSLPSSAVIFLAGKYFVFVEPETDKFEKREVRMLRDASASVVVVRGVKPGERVVSEGALLLNEMLPETEPADDAVATRSSL
ncbi:MAG: efflux RND transporter periplasmic adaptor subunit [Verrucomicrobia bacterium]|nr:efflux RND transporter periplasmic adaptor subunit [Verrucomicrobiota bacterium]